MNKFKRFEICIFIIFSIIDTLGYTINVVRGIK